MLFDADDEAPVVESVAPVVDPNVLDAKVEPVEAEEPCEPEVEDAEPVLVDPLPVLAVLLAPVLVEALEVVEVLTVEEPELEELTDVVESDDEAPPDDELLEVEDEPLEVEDEPDEMLVVTGGTQEPFEQVHPSIPQSAAEEHWVLHADRPNTPNPANASTRRFIACSLCPRRDRTSSLSQLAAEANTWRAARTADRC